MAFQAWQTQVQSLLQQAALQSPGNADVFTLLGVVEGINQNHEGAVQAMAAACRLRPNSHASWNSLGTTLMSVGRSQDALVAYHQALALKPNYARVWSNLAIAHANLGQHVDAARFHVSALVLSPEATYAWDRLRATASQLGDVLFDGATDRRDVNGCRQCIDGVLDPSTLPPPRLELSEPPDTVLAQIGL